MVRALAVLEYKAHVGRKVVLEERHTVPYMFLMDRPSVAILMRGHIPTS